MQRDGERQRASDGDDGHTDGEATNVPVRSGHHVRETLNVREQVTKRRGRAARAVEGVARGLAHPATFGALLAFHLAWLVLNSGLVPGVVVFDPPPYVLLATLASAAAPFLAILILLGQHREARIDELRDEITVEIALQAERKATAALQLLLRDLDPRGAPFTPAERERLEELTEPLDAEELLTVVLENLNRVEGAEPGLSPDQ